MLAVLAAAVWLSALDRAAIVSFKLPIDTIQAVGAAGSGYVAIKLYRTVVDKIEPKTNYWLLEAASKKTTPLPEAWDIAPQNPGHTVDLVMGNRVVWRVSLRHPSLHEVVRTHENIKGICFCGETNDACYISDKAGRLIHRHADGREVAFKIQGSREDPFRIVDYKPGRCLLESYTRTDNEGTVFSKMRWLSTSTLKPMGQDSGESGDGDPIGVTSRGQLIFFGEPPMIPGKIGPSTEQLVEVEDLITGRTEAATRIPWRVDSPTQPGLSSSGVSDVCVFCDESKEVAQIQGNFYPGDRLVRTFYGYRIGAKQTTLLYQDAWRYHDDIADHATTCALTNDRRYLVAIAHERNQVKIVPLKRW